MEIRRARPGDFAAIHRVVEDAFEGPVEATLVRLLRSSSSYLPALELVAVDGERVAGHAMLIVSAIVEDASTRRVLTLAPVSVAPALQRRGAGSMLVRSVLALAERRDEPLMTVEGPPRYYERFGFRDAREYGITFPLPDWAPPDAGRIYPLPGYDPAITGTVAYPLAFEAAARIRSRSDS